METADPFRRFVADLSTRFSGIAAERVNGEIDRALEGLVELLGTDRSSLLQLVREDGSMVVSHSWARPGVAAAQPGTRLSGVFNWYHARLRRGEVLRFDRFLDAIPPEAVAERTYASELPVLSHLGVPLLVAGRDRKSVV